MKYLLLATILTHAVSAFSLGAWSSLLDNIPQPFSTNGYRLLEFGPGQQKLVKESEVYKLRAAGSNFIDVTDHIEFYNSRTDVVVQDESSQFPDAVHFRPQVERLSQNISRMNMKNNLSQLTSFFTRYFKSEDGYRSSAWISQQIADIAEANPDITVDLWDHEWQQKSVVARIPGSKNPDHVVILSSHLDSVNGKDPYDRSPGADDDGSGTVTIWEVFRVLVESGFQPENTVEFHWYSAEEGGLLGSQDIYVKYAQEEKQVKAMLQQDMTGYTSATLASGDFENFGVVTDLVNPSLTNYVKLLIDEYSDIGYIEFQCGYGCSDHASAFRVGYPSSFVIETGSGKKAPNVHVHTDDDVVKYLDFKHMSRHAKLSLAFVYELAFYGF